MCRWEKLRDFYLVCNETVSGTLDNCGTTAGGRFSRGKLDNTLTREAIRRIANVLVVVERVEHRNVEAVLFRAPKYGGQMGKA
jgi:hypothetical protein